MTKRKVDKIDPFAMYLSDVDDTGPLDKTIDNSMVTMNQLTTMITKRSGDCVTEEAKHVEIGLPKLGDSLSIFLPYSKRHIRATKKKVDPRLCDIHPMNVRSLGDHNRRTLEQRIASFMRIGQLEPAIATMSKIDNRYKIVDGAGRLAAWKIIQEDYKNELHYTGEVFEVLVVDMPDLDAIEISKTRNESESLSEFNQAKLYQSMLVNGYYKDLTQLCNAEGISYEKWRKTIKLSHLDDKYLQLFVHTSHISTLFALKASKWESMLINDNTLLKSFTERLNCLGNFTNEYIAGHSDKAAYDIKSKNIRPLINELDAVFATNVVPKKSELVFETRNAKFKFISDGTKQSILFEKIRQADLEQIQSFVMSLTGAEKPEHNSLG